MQIHTWARLVSALTLAFTFTVTMHLTGLAMWILIANVMFSCATLYVSVRGEPKTA